MYLNVGVIVYVNIYIYILIYIYIYTTQPTLKVTKHTWCEQVDSDVNIPHSEPSKKAKIGVSLRVAWRRRW